MTMNVIAILNHMGVYLRRTVVNHRALEHLNFQIVARTTVATCKLIENNARLCSVYIG